MKIYYNVLDRGVAFMSYNKTFIFSDRPDVLHDEGLNYDTVSELLRLINCEKIFGCYHEMMVSEELIIRTLTDNGYEMIKVDNLGGLKSGETRYRKQVA